MLQLTFTVLTALAEISTLEELYSTTIYIFSLLIPCIQGSTHLPWLLSLSFKEFESTSKLPNFPSAVSCFSGAMASLAVRLVLNVSLNSAIMLPFLYKLEFKKMSSTSQKIKAPVCMYPGYSWKRKFRFSAFNNTRPHEAYLNRSTSTGKRLKTMETIGSLTEHA